MWQDFVAWLQSPAGARVLQSAIIPALAIVVAAVVATLIARTAVRAAIRRSERAEASSAIGALVATAGASGSDDEHVKRLRAEADVRTRLLPLAGAGLAADWAAARLDAVQRGSATTSGDIDQLRDRLVEWVGKPGKAKRLFSTPEAPAARPTPAKPEAATAEPQVSEPKVPAVEQIDPEVAEPDRFARPAGPRRTPAPDQPAAAAPIPELDPQPVPVGATPAAAAESAMADVPAWQRTRAGERLQQERTRPRSVEPPAVDEDDAVPLSTAPVQLAQAHRSPVTPSADSDEAVRLEAHQQARHARPDSAPAGAETEKGAAATATPVPAWLDTYDDEAQVTQNLDLKTPPPVAAAAIRDRGAPGEDLVPRS